MITEYQMLMTAVQVFSGLTMNR